MIIITNNPKVKEEVQGREVLFKEDTTYIGILEASRDLIHEGYELLSHPLYGSVKPNETPYRTVILKKGNRLDINSLTLIEEAIITASKFQNNKKTPKWTESVQDDFRVIDYDIFYNTIQRMQYE
ncbi:TPA: GrdX family protein [Clostridioides difficile]